ncbi:hypothetical protein EK904_011816 [Melospiza melodia maxima]|nr:hypothetical protein EK904_011816 [Melospiza melodia maxima]
MVICRIQQTSKPQKKLSGRTQTATGVCRETLPCTSKPHQLEHNRVILRNDFKTPDLDLIQSPSLERHDMRRFGEGCSCFYGVNEVLYKDAQC